MLKNYLGLFTKGFFFSWVSKTHCSEIGQLNMYDMKPSNHNLEAMKQKEIVDTFFLKCTLYILLHVNIQPYIEIYVINKMFQR